MYYNESVTQSESAVRAQITSIPQNLYVDGETGALFAHVAGDKKSGMKLISGLAVFNKTDPGKIAYVAVPPQTIDKRGVARQHLICTIHSNHSAPSSRQFDFSTKSASCRTPADGKLLMNVSEFKGLNSETGTVNVASFVRSGQENSTMTLFVGPGSVSIGEDLTDAEQTQLNFEKRVNVNWGNLFKGVARAVPMLAQTGLDIYEQLTNQSNSDINETEDEGSEVIILGSILGAVASAAVPFVGSLLSKIVK